jgi:hypothetical protein
MLFENVDEAEKQEYTGKSPDVFEGYKVRRLWVRLSHSAVIGGLLKPA